MDCSLQGSSVHGVFQARVLEWGAKNKIGDANKLMYARISWVQELGEVDEWLLGWAVIFFNAINPLMLYMRLLGGQEAKV